MKQNEAVLKERISNLSERAYVTLSGRGTTALYLLLKSLDMARTKDVFLPSMICHSVPLAAAFAGYRIRSVDIDPNTFNADFSNTMLNGIVLAVHLFGYPATISGRYLDDSAVVVNDIAQSVGGKYCGKPMGSDGLAAILSFSRGKLIPAGHGGAVATNDANLHKEIERIKEKLAPKAPTFDRLQKIYKNINYHLEYLFEKRMPMEFDYVEVVGGICRDLFLYDFDGSYASAITGMLDSIEKSCQDRYLVYKKLKNHFADFKPDVILPKYHNEEECHWYYFSFLLTNEDARPFFLQRLRENGVHVSTCYLPLAYWCKGVSDASCIKANVVAKRIVNLHIEPCMDGDYLNRLLKLCDGYLLNKALAGSGR